jgi:uncharacterized membrane protein YbaN (DUF454 family)
MVFSFFLLKRVAIFRIRASRFEFLFCRMSLSQNRNAYCADHAWPVVPRHFGSQIKPKGREFNPLARNEGLPRFFFVRDGTPVLPADMRIFYLCLGCLMVATGVVGAFLPLLPTTPFLLLALWCFSKSSPRLEAWLLNHPRFGKTLRNWREHGAIPRRAKIAAVSLMTMSYLFYLIIMAPLALHALIVAAVMIGAGTFVVTRPSPPKD